MATEPDPYRALGLPRTATLDEVKRAYRRLAKANHPDAAGEAALPRFLAIQAAYDRIAGPDTTRGQGTRAAWDADPHRADATRRAYGNRARARPRPTASPNPGTPPSAGAPPAPGRPPTGAGGTRANPPSGRGLRRRRATLGSTSYDEAAEGPFEPGWGGASWYGTSSGTYWTLNPKEYADPRKHGPEYQARARRASQSGDRSSDSSANGDGPTEPLASNAGPDPASPSPGHTTRSWWDATAGAPADGSTPSEPATASASVHNDAEDERRQPPNGTASPPGGRAPRDPRPHTIDELRAWVASDNPGLALRLGRAALGWAPIALGIGWLAGEMTGCGRFAASCDASAAPVAWFAQVVALALLLIVPPLARIAAIAAIATVAAAIAGTFLLTATGSAGDGDWGRLALGATLVIAWLVGIAYAVAREVRTLGEGGPGGEFGGARSRHDSAAGDGPVS